MGASARLISLASWQLLLPTMIFFKKRNLQRFVLEKTRQLMATSYFTLQRPATNAVRKIAPKDGAGNYQMSDKEIDMKMSDLKQMNASCAAKFCRTNSKLLGKENEKYGQFSKLTITTHSKNAKENEKGKNELSVIEIS